MNSKDKGDRWERELAAILNRRLFNGHEVVRRMPLSGGGRSFGGGGDQDLLGLPAIWAECKNTERLEVWAALRQAHDGVTRTGRPEYPTVFARRNRIDPLSSLVIMRLDDWLKLYDAFLTLNHRAAQEAASRPPAPPDWRFARETAAPPSGPVGPGGAAREDERKDDRQDW